MTKPRSLDTLAGEILDRLAQYPEASEIVLGGYFALQHYTDYRRTRDIDAWWRTSPSSATEDTIRGVVEEVANKHEFAVRERRFGDTLSFEIVQGTVKHFSFQIALRSISLEEPRVSAWPPILIETLRENVASKMNALVNRGAPRDFLDIKRIVDEGLLSIEDCWSLWERKNPGQTTVAAVQKVLLFLELLEARRPLESIPDADLRAQAREVREWYRNTFLRSS